MLDPTPTSAAASWLSFALSYLLLAVVPGPNFLVVSDAGLTSRWSDALSAAFGIALGACLLSAVVSAAAGMLIVDGTVREIAATLFGCYLIFLGLKSCGRAGAVRRLMHMQPARQSNGYFRLAFLTAVANPTTALFVGSSGAVAHQALPLMAFLAIPATVFMIAFLWFALVGVALSTWGQIVLPARMAGGRDFVFGVVFLALGTVSIVSAQT